ncbi:MAG: sensor histidine kinase [Saprospiraceae bacterium]|nr:sensor histidine kinase [Saprospiraceae bacterium]
MNGHLKWTRFAWLNNNLWVYLALFLVLSAERATNLTPHSWQHYLSCLTVLAGLNAPLLAFTYWREWLKVRLSIWAFWLLWTGVFLVIPIIIASLSQLRWQFHVSLFGMADYFVMLAVLLPALDLGLLINALATQKGAIINWLEKWGIDGTILIGITFFSLLFSMMIVSNQEIFDRQELIMPSVDLALVFRHFFRFLAYALQFSLIYLSLYFFYLLNSRFLIPEILKRRGILLYAIGVAGGIALFFPILSQILVSLPLVRDAKSLMPSQTLVVFTELNALLPGIVLITSLPLIVAFQWFKQNSEITKLEKQHIESELLLLKQQINPHFFFNTLHNLYSLSLAKSDQTPEVIVQLSELMRYVIYKGKEKEVPLSEEINYIEDYLHLQQIRLHKDFELQFNKSVEDPSFLLPPLLLIILIENAFKHGIEPAEEKCFLSIDLRSDSKSLSFNCSNSFEPNPDNEAGIGLENLQRRLSLLFPYQHHFSVQEGEGVFTANLEVWNP